MYKEILLKNSILINNLINKKLEHKVFKFVVNLSELTFRYGLITTINNNIDYWSNDAYDIGYRFAIWNHILWEFEPDAKPCLINGKMITVFNNYDEIYKYVQFKLRNEKLKRILK